MSRKKSTFTRNLERIEDAFDRDALARICEMDERDFPEAFGLVTTEVQGRPGADFFAFRDNGASVLGVAHLDTVSASGRARAAHFVDTQAGPVVFSRALDDRLGAYVLLDLLPKLGVEVDVLLTVGEEIGQSTAAYFESDDKQYDWAIEFDRGGTDVVMYEFEDQDLIDRVLDSKARVGVGSFSDIAELEHLGCKALNWGIGYRDYHSARSHAFLDDTFTMVARYLTFDRQNKGQHLPHTQRPAFGSYRYGSDDLESYAWAATSDADKAKAQERLDAWLGDSKAKAATEAEDWLAGLPTHAFE